MIEKVWREIRACCASSLSFKEGINLFGDGELFVEP